MTGFIASAYALKGVTALAAWLTSRRNRELRCVAGFLSISLASDLIRLALITWIIAPARAAFAASGGDPSSPTPGVALAVITDRTLFLSWSAGLAALALVTFLQRRPWPVLAVWATMCGVFIAAYPEPRLQALRRVYLAVDLAALLVGAGSVVIWTWRRLHPSVEHAAVLLLLTTELGSIAAGPFAQTSFFTTWPLSVLMYSFVNVVLLAIFGGWHVVRGVRDGGNL